jgi:acetyl-CoA C-acetyltransferase
MGMCGEKCSSDYSISREEQDAYSVESYRRAQEAVASGVFEEVVPVEIKQRRGDPIIVDKDEEPGNIKVDKIPGEKKA